MNKILVIVATIMVATLTTQCKNSATDNPLLQAEWGTPFETPPFDKILPEHYLPAVEVQLKIAKEGIDKIVNNSEAPTFQNTVEAIEFNGSELNRTLGVFYNINEAHTSDELQDIAMKLSPILTEYGNDISLNENLFARVKVVYEQRAKLGLNVEQAMLLEDCYKGFVRSGANLSDGDKEKYRQITAELAKSSLEYGQNNLAATNAFELTVSDIADLAGLPENNIEEAASIANGRAKSADQAAGYIFTLDAPVYTAFMKYVDNRDLREKMWMGRNLLCSQGGAYDNQERVKRIAELRFDMAKLLGYTTYAEYALDNRMAETPAKVMTFLNELLDKSLDFARKDVKMIQEFANSKGFQGELMPWDFGYYDNKYVTETYAVNDEMTRPYFQLEKAQDALFMLANKLYGITFVENKDIPVYEADVKAYEVHDKDGTFLAVFYCDYFPRPSKRSGAWMNTFRDAGIKDGKETRPIVINVNNFTKSTATAPSLLSYGEFTTMLHEFGHALHGIFGKGHYSSQTGTSVYRDFVELPSQIMENWAAEKEYLDLFAVHYKTGEKMPEELINKLIAQKNHLAAYGQVRQLSFSLMDMAWHIITEPVTISVEEFEKNSSSKAQVLPIVKGAIMSPNFGHIFSGGYAAGYYSYKWAEVLEADAYNIFQKQGIFDKETAERFRQTILSQGGTKHPMELYKEFAGAEPTVDPLLRKMGLIN